MVKVIKGAIQSALSIPYATKLGKEAAMKSCYSTENIEFCAFVADVQLFPRGHR